MVRERYETMWANLRSGNWVNEQRLKVYPLILLVGAALVIMAMIAMTHDRLGPDDRPSDDQEGPVECGLACRLGLNSFAGAD